LQAHATEDAVWRVGAPTTQSPPLGLDVVDVGVLPLADRLHDLADVHAVLDDGIADGHVLKRNLVADRNVLAAFELDRAVLVEDETGETRTGPDAFDDDDGDRVVGIVQYAMDHGDSWMWRAGRRRMSNNRIVVIRRGRVNYIIHIICAKIAQPLDSSAPMTAIDDATPAGFPLDVPLYKDVKRRLTDALTRGEWKPGAAIPAERRLSERFRISVGTVRKAIDELVAENILIRQQGRGTFVATHNREREMFYFLHVVPERGTKQYPDVQLLSFGRGKADSRIAGALGIAAGDGVFRIRNLLRLDGIAVIVDDIALPAQRFAGLTERQFRDRRSTVYNLYQEAFGLSVVKTRERVRAARADAANGALLDVTSATPLLQIRRVALTYRESPVEYRVSLVNTQRHEYWAEIGT
jgi:GntR family transcriptional regulator